MEHSPGFSVDMENRVYIGPNQGSCSRQSSSHDNRTWTLNAQHAAGELKRSLHGNDYQLKLLMLFASKGENSEVAFRLATEMAEAEKFDDVVFRYTDSLGVTKYRFLQAKHRQFLGEENRIKVSDLKSESDNNDFSLQKYFVSYLKNIENVQFQDGVPEDFIICTNTGFDFEPSTTKNEQQKTIESKKAWKTYFSEKMDDDRILNLGGKRYQFNRDPNIRTKITSEVQLIFQKSLEKNKLSDAKIVEKINGFLDILVFAIEQPSGERLEKKIKDALGNEFNLINDIVYIKFLTFMYEWMKHRIKDPGEIGGGRAYFLTNQNVKQFLSEARKEIASLGLRSSLILCQREFDKFRLRFKDDNEVVKKIREFLNKQGSKERILIICSKSRLPSKIKVFQTLSSHNEDRIVFSDLKSLSLLKGSSVDPGSAFSSEGRDFLIVEILSALDKDARDSLSSFYQIVIQVPGKKLILITRPEQKGNIQKLFKDENYMKIIQDDENRLKDLTLMSKEKILETEIILFGEKRKLSSLTTDASEDDLDFGIEGDTLTTLINGDINVIGSERKYDFDTHIDIERTLTYQTMIDKKCFEENKNDIFAISGIEERDFYQLIPEEERRRDPKGKDPIRIFRLGNHSDIKKDFDQLSLHYKKCNIHLLENKASGLEWKQSHGSLFNLRRFVVKSEAPGRQLDDLTDSAIITGEPGMGKSTILTTDSIKTGSLWPIRVNLKHYETHIDKANFGDFSGIVGFLSNVIEPESSKTSLIKDLLRYSLNRKGQVTVLLDGYDEIKDHNQEKVVLLLRTLRSTQGKVLITTRSHAQSELEDALGIFAHSLNPFDKKQQKEFLEKFWIERLDVKESTQEKKIDKFANQLLSHFHGLNLMKKEGLVGIVLQARMVAEIFQNECKGYLEDEQFNFSGLRIANTFDLYERFIEYQYERYLKERIEISTKLSEDSRASLARSYTKAYGNVALKSLFSEDQIRGLLRKERFSGEELQDVGLVKISKNDGTADFLHPTYAEHFAADLLADALGKEEDHPKYRAVHNFLLMQIFRDQNKVIRAFIENKIKKENDGNLSSKWKAIQNCNLLEEVETEAELQHSRQSYDATSDKDLSLLQLDVEECMNWYNDGYYYNGYVQLIEKLFQKFSSEMDIKALKSTLEFLLKANRKSYYGKANAVFSHENNICKAVAHFLTQVKLQDMLNHEFVQDTLKRDCVKAVIDTEMFSRWEEMLNRLKDPDKEEKEKHLKEVIDFLFPEGIGTLEILRDLRFCHYFLDIFYPDIAEYVKSRIASDKNTHQEFTTRIINSLKDIRCGNGGIINGELWHAGGSLFADILFHPGVISHTNSSINELYEDKDLGWLERKGVLISRVLEIITPEMVERFNSVLDGNINGFTRIYAGGVFVDLIHHIVNRVTVEKLPQINRLAFLKMLVHFVSFSVKADRELPFTSEQIKTTLKLITDMLNERRQLALVVSESIEYLSILRKAGLKLIGGEKELLVIHPAGEFECKLSCDYMYQVVELIRWRNENRYESKKEILKKCYETVEFTTGSVKRKRCESDLQELKRLKTVCII